MSLSESQRAAHHASQRRMKRFLRYAPRRAVFHRYPLVGRFAALARRRAYLWSFKRNHVRPAFYVGSVLALWPLTGIQLVLAFAACLLMRSNVMITGALQFITNPFTVAPIYYGTYLVGKYVLSVTGLTGESAPVTEAPGMGETVTLSLSSTGALPRQFEWASSFGSTVMALFVGGTLCGLILALALDFAYMMTSRRAHKHHRARSRSAG